MIKIRKSLNKSEIWLRNKFTEGQALIDLLLLTYNATTRVKIRNVYIDVNRGEVCYSVRKLAKRWKWSVGKVIRYLDNLETIGLIEQHNSNITKIIKIKNYNLYECD
jgi:hypothetical protein